MLKNLNTLERLALGLFTALLLLSAGLFLYQQNLSPQHAEARLGGNFSLNSASGPVSLSDFAGKGVIIMFGYASCPDVCPSGLANVAAALNRLSASKQAQLQPLFISVDPDRDTPDRLEEYSRYFHPSLRGLTGSKNEIDAVVEAYGGFYQKVSTPDSKMGYSVDHSARIYLIKRNGELSQRLFHNSPVAEITTALDLLLEE